MVEPEAVAHHKYMDLYRLRFEFMDHVDYVVKTFVVCKAAQIANSKRLIIGRFQCLKVLDINRIMSYMDSFGCNPTVNSDLADCFIHDHELVRSSHGDRLCQLGKW